MVRDLRGRPLILVIDDTPTNLHVMNGLLREQFATRVATSGHQGIQLALREPRPDLILLDVMMPGMDGYEVCERLKEDPRTESIPIIFLTARTGTEDEERGFAAGAVDYIAKPISPPTALARIRTHLLLKQAFVDLEDRAAWLEAQVEERTRQIRQTQDAMFVALATLAETRDNDTGNHIRRTQRYIELLCMLCRESATCPETIDATMAGLIVRNAPLHDIGKVGVPDHILLKPGRLTPEEFEVMKTHAALGYEALRRARERIPDDDGTLEVAMQIARSHHERWDGTGYPDGLAADEIPLPARMMAIADVYDALVCSRAYKVPMSHDEAVALMRSGRGTQFDPFLLDLFLEHHESFAAIHDALADEIPG